MSVVIDGSNGVDIGAGNLTFPDNTTQSTAPTSIGVGQTWQDMTASRALSTTYTNNTGNPIQLSIRALCTSTASFSIVVQGNVIGYSQGYSAGSIAGTLTAIVPNGNTYGTTITGAATLSAWFELR